MVQINLLPVTLRKKRKVKVKLKVKLGPAIFILVAVIVTTIVVWAILGLRLAGKQKELSSLNEQLKSLRFTLQKSGNLEQEQQRLLRKLEFLEQALKREVLWAENLKHLSKVVPPGIWLKKLDLRTKKEAHLYKYTELKINGLAVSLQGEEMNLISGFMSALEKDEVFSEQFSEVKLISSKRSKTGKIETMDFQLSCQFRGVGPATTTSEELIELLKQRALRRAGEKRDKGK